MKMDMKKEKKLARYAQKVALANYCNHFGLILVCNWTRQESFVVEL